MSKIQQDPAEPRKQWKAVVRAGLGQNGIGSQGFNPIEWHASTCQDFIGSKPACQGCEPS